jgi:phosphatidylinositol 4-kinase
MRQSAVSTLYALLNEITRYSDEESVDQVNSSNIVGAPAADQLSESQKQQVCVNTLSAIINVAVYLADESVS